MQSLPATLQIYQRVKLQGEVSWKTQEKLMRFQISEIQPVADQVFTSNPVAAAVLLGLLATSSTPSLTAEDIP